MSQVPFFNKDGKFLGSVESEKMKGDCKHLKTKDVGTCSEGCCDRVECLDCGTRFTIECPD